MRLTCPNCGAQYEIDAGLIPSDGRDVQCSNCNHTWYEMPEGAAEPVPAPPPSKPPKARKSAEDAPESAAESPAPKQTADADQAAPDDLPPMPDAPSSSLDPEIASILREEAEHERKQRAREGSSIESQPDLGLDVPAAALAGDRPRRERLPDIEEINSSLRDDSTDAATAPADTARKGSGFWRGFWLVIMVVALAWAVYVFAPQIAARVPQLADPLAAYAEWVNGLRLWLDGVVAQIAPDNG